MLHFRRLVLLLMLIGTLLAGCGTARAVADAMAGEPAATVASITFEGNNRTREQVLRRAVEVEPGDPYTAETAEEIRNDLRALGLFSSVAVEPTPGEVSGSGSEVPVVVTVEERWTLVPIPFFRTGSTGAAGGLFVLESNLLGYNKQLIAGATYGTDGFGGLLVYNDPAAFGSDWLFSVSASAGRDDVETATPAYEDRFRYAADRISGGGALGYRFSERVSLRAGADLRYIEVSDSDRPDTVEPGPHRSTAARIEASYRDLEPEDFFERGLSVRAAGELAPADGAWTVDGSASRDWLLFGGHRLGLEATAAIGEQPALFEPRLGGRSTQRTLARSTVASDSYATAGGSYEAPVLTPDWGTITLLAFYEGGYVGSADAVYHGGGGGVRLYLSRVTFPALGFDVAWNARYAYPVVSFAFGGRF